MTTLADTVDELDTLVRARYPVLAVETHEEERLRNVLNGLAQHPKHRSRGLYAWSRTKGLVQLLAPAKNGEAARSLPQPIADTEVPEQALKAIGKHTTGLWLLCDFASYLMPYGQEDPYLVRMLRELAWQAKTQQSTIIISGPVWPAIKALEKEVRVVELPLPDATEVNQMVEARIDESLDVEGVSIDLADGYRTQVDQALLGLTAQEIENALASALIRHRGLNPDAIPTILDEKRSVIRQSGSLTYTHPEPSSSLGGYANLRRILEQDAVTFTPAAKEFGVEPSKGLLLVGLPGCGKDLIKKIASSIMGRPLLDLDFGSVMGEGGGILGQAEQSIKRALSLATTVQGILGISEFEKAVGGLESSGKTDGGTTARAIGHLLNWMQEQEGVYVIATANDVRALRPEQIRQGRFSNIAFVDLPSETDREDIFAVHLEKRGRNPAKYCLNGFAEAANGFSGAEIEAAVKGALLDAFMAGDSLADQHVMSRIQSIRPTSEVKREEIEELREWAKTHMIVQQEATETATGRRLEY